MFKRYWWVLLVMLLVGPLAGLFIGGVLAYIQPKLYESSAVIQIRPSPNQSPQREIATQAEILTSGSILEEVSERLDLPSAWGSSQSEVTAKLKRSISVKPISGTDLIEVSARLAQPTNCTDVVETVVEVYSEHRLIKSPVIIHSNPVLPHSPVSPNVPLNLAIGSLAGLIGGLLLAFPIMALLNRRAAA